MKGFPCCYLRQSQERHPWPGLREAGRSWLRTCGPTLDFASATLKPAQLKDYPLLWTQLGDDQTCVNTHKLWTETWWAWGSNRGTGSRRPDLLQMVQSSTVTDPWVTLDEPLPFFVPLCPAIFYLPLSYRLRAVCFRHVCTALRTKGPWSHWWPLSPSAACFIIK